MPKHEIASTRKGKFMCICGWKAKGNSINPVQDISDHVNQELSRRFAVRLGLPWHIPYQSEHRIEDRTHWRCSCGASWIGDKKGTGLYGCRARTQNNKTIKFLFSDSGVMEVLRWAMGQEWWPVYISQRYTDYADKTTVAMLAYISLLNGEFIKNLDTFLTERGM
jgi:hypothetical protein